MDYIIETQNLTKTYGKLIAVNKLNLKIKRGDIFGFLGPNGAGKSTTIRMLCGILQPNEGTAKINGFDIINKSEKIKESIGYVTQRFGLYDDLTVQENLSFYASLYNLSEDTINNNIKNILTLLKLTNRANSIVKELSGGLKQRLSIGCAMVHNPEIIFLDEPTAGVDPISRKEMWEVFNHLSQQGITIFITTHYMEEAERCNNIGFIFNGILMAADTPANFKKSGKTLEAVYVSFMNQ
ncbi:MAG: ABC transporter ATP-binding protein [Elusimicrobia bacterium RIFOXYC2_FULL_34_12]|nr:MAG: ABC transporter ATP-binding protein [Elusimicrobia bacterium RIFOXYC2_FULL_34_12]OGS38760.1 MAG: ABC transporter ATP-binding protein [Elusimicrobia bacterium RIFOXYD2_FULL_34_30]HAM38957.1 ABC transporter ATP-binding protein [Elusimicrobiota bacterium]